MLVLWAIFVIIVHCIFLLVPWKPKENKDRVTLSPAETLKQAVILILNQHVPNYEIALQLKHTFGNLFAVFLPFTKRKLAVISELNLAKKLMSSSEWSNRCWKNHYLHSTTFNKPIGLLFASDEYWKEARRLTFKFLHHLDFFKPYKMEKLVACEIAEVEAHLMEMIKMEGQGSLTFSPHQMLEINTLNVVSQVILGRRFSHHEPIAEKIIVAMNQANRDFNAGYSVLDICPWLRFIPGLTFINSFQNASNVCYDFCMEEIKSRRKSGTYKSNPTDFTDYFLIEIDNHIENNSKIITDEVYLAVMRDLIFAGTDTTNTSIEHAILHMALNPEMQQRVQTEIDQVIGSQRLPSYHDRLRMPYTQAVIHEILRIATPIPASVRSPLTDNHINGEEMTKGSLTGINIYAIHRSEDLWEDPYVFNPQRFLNEHGCIVNTEKIIPFGYGKRYCIGESVARLALFMFFVCLMRKFSWEVSKSHPEPSLKNIPGLSRCPIPYFVCIRERKNTNSKCKPH